MKYEKPSLEELELILEGSFLDNSTDLGIGGPGGAGTPWE